MPVPLVVSGVIEEKVELTTKNPSCSQKTVAGRQTLLGVLTSSLK